MLYVCHASLFCVAHHEPIVLHNKKKKKACKPEVAGELLRKFNESQGVPHRVSAYVAGTGLGTLRADMEAHASGRGMSPRLRQEIIAYQLCMLDDSVADVVHRDVHLRGIVLLRLS